MTCAHDYFINKLVRTVARQDLKSDWPGLKECVYDFLTVLPWAIFLTWTSVTHLIELLRIKWDNISKALGTETGIQNVSLFQQK